MYQYDLIIVTDDSFVGDAVEDTQNVRDVVEEDSIIQNSLEKRGLRVSRVSWADPDFNWASTKAALISTTWDYSHRFTEFFNWFEKVNTLTLLINSYDTIKWNIDKHYLKELEDKGINIASTIFIEKNDLKSLKSIFKQTGWNEAVLKPSISAGGRHTYRINNNNIEQYESLFGELLKDESMMLQEFQNNIVSKGEVAHMIMGNTYTHSILKKAQSGDFRVQDDFGGSIELYEASKEEIEFAMRVINSFGKETTYARVDAFYDNNNHLALGELEVMEPELWFRFNKKAADIMSDSVIDLLEKL